MERTIDTKDLMIGYRRRSSGYNGSISRFFSISAAQGELVALVGLNGAGKSTLLRTLAGLQKPIDGKVNLCGKGLIDYSRNELARAISFVSTETVSVPYLKVFDLAAMGRYPYTGRMGRLSMEDKFRVMDALELAGLRSMTWRNVDTLSDGERQRVMIAQTLVQDTPIVLFDEPTAYLDVPNKYEMLSLLQRLAHNQNKTIVYSTHDIPMAMRTADKVWLMVDATIREGAPEDYSILYSIQELFNGTKLEYNRSNRDIVSESVIHGDIVAYTKNDPQQVRHALTRWGYNCILNPRTPREDLPAIHLLMKKADISITYIAEGKETHFGSFYELGLHLRQHPPKLPKPAVQAAQ
jgi:iron complex transport system ATP-binding protein